MVTVGKKRCTISSASDPLLGKLDQKHCRKLYTYLVPATSRREA